MVFPPRPSARPRGAAQVLWEIVGPSLRFWHALQGSPPVISPVAGASLHKRQPQVITKVPRAFAVFARSGHTWQAPRRGHHHGGPVLPYLPCFAIESLRGGGGGLLAPQRSPLSRDNFLSRSAALFTAYHEGEGLFRPSVPAPIGRSVRICGSVVVVT